MGKMTLRKRISFNVFLSAINSLYRNYFKITRKKLGYIADDAYFRQPILIKGAKNVYIYDNSVILGHAKILTTLAKFIMKKNSGAAEGLTVVTGNHQSFPGRWFRDVEDDEKDAKMDKDVIVEEDVWIGTNVTLLSGVHVGRGAEVGSGSVCRGNIPPYAIVTGNPAKIIGYRFTPEQVEEHEKALYAEDDRTDMKKMIKNYNRYFENRESVAKHLSLY